MGFIASLWMVLKQVYNNWRLELALLLGLVVAVGIVSSVPTYTDAALQYAFMKQWAQQSDGKPPGTFTVIHRGMDGGKPKPAALRTLDNFLLRQVPRRMGMPVQHVSLFGELDNTMELNGRGNEVVYAKLSFIRGLDKLVDITQGRWFKDKMVSKDTVEAVVDFEAVDEMELILGRTYDLPIITEDGSYRHIKVKLVGVYKTKKGLKDSPAWPASPPFKDTFFINTDTVFDEMLKIDGINLSYCFWYWVFDHTGVKVSQLADKVKALKFIDARSAQILINTSAFATPISTFEYFADQSRVLTILMLALSIPILGMVFYYIILAASLTISKRRNEIAMLRSRGASLQQILMSYALEWGVLALAALVLGPLVGLTISKVIGASAGFLSFVDRTALPAELARKAYTVSIQTLVIAVLSALIPVIVAARHSIVTYKQEAARNGGVPVWQRFGLDFILLLVSIYGYRALNNQTLQVSANSENATLVLDPLLFLVPALFLLSVGLVTLRIYPLILKLLHMLTQRWAGVSWVVTITELSRNPGQYSPLILLLILTVSMGIYSASTARTLGRNFEDRIHYINGTDVILTEQWRIPGGGGMSETYGSGGAPQTDEDGMPVRQEEELYEPPFYVHKTLPGVEAAARVLREENVDIEVGGNNVATGVMVGIDPVDFAATTWWRFDMAPHHVNGYLNLLIDHPEGVILSQRFMRQNRLKQGDWVTLKIDQKPVDFFIVASIPHWTTVLPGQEPFFVTNLEYVQQQYVIKPYNIWLKMKPGAKMAPVIEALAKQKIWVTMVQDARNEVIMSKRQPQLMGMFGMLSTSFLVSVIITMMGFFLYTFLSLRSRFLQFGVLRAIGLSAAQLVTMLFLEQVLSCGLGIAIGTIVGAYTSSLFLPMVQASAEMAKAVPNFLLVIERADLLRIYLVVGGMLLAGLVGLATILTKMKLASAVKLGEDS